LDSLGCQYCGSYLLRLSRFESPAQPQPVEGREDAWFRSLAWVYRIALVIGAALFVILYFVAFDSFSETELVTLSPVWFLLLNFGLSGLYAEKAVRLVLRGEAETFTSALATSTESIPLLFRLGAWLVFLPPFAVLNLKTVSSPLRLSVTTTLAWAALLYLFLVGIFPAL
jgi:hypothetical protein